MVDDYLQGPQVTPIGEADEPPPEPAPSPAPRPEGMVGYKKPENEPDDTGDTSSGATQADIARHAYGLAKRHEEDLEKSRQTYSGMQEEIRRLYQEEQRNAGTPFPQAQAYPEEPKYAYRPLALLHLMMAIPQAIFGGQKYNRAGAINGLNAAIQEFRDSGTNGIRMALYREQVNIIHQQNEERLKQYHDIMADNRADIHTKLETIKTLADVYKDKATADAAETDDWEKFSKYLAGVQKSQEDTETNVYGTMDKLHKLFGDDESSRAYRSWGAETYPDLAEGLFSENDPRAFGKAVRELEKRHSFYKWRKEYWEEQHPHTVEQQQELDEENRLKAQKPPPDTPTNDMRKAIEDMHPDLLFGTPKPGEQKPKEPKSKREALGYDPRRPFDKAKPTPTPDE